MPATRRRLPAIFIIAASRDGAPPVFVGFHDDLGPRVRNSPAGLILFAAFYHARYLPLWLVTYYHAICTRQYTAGKRLRRHDVLDVLPMPIALFLVAAEVR